MGSENGWKDFLGPTLLLILVFFVWFLRYPMWRLLGYMEPIFLMLILSYIAVFVLALVFLKKEAKRSLSKFFRRYNYRTMLIGTYLAVLFQIIWRKFYFFYLRIGWRNHFN